MITDFGVIDDEMLHVGYKLETIEEEDDTIDIINEEHEETLSSHTHHLCCREEGISQITPLAS
ncbi:hypothetical protein M8C21_005614 [Ambrosia artemisiifolia]|uniref:Uncharacterized protein n=1 Tax=Ambrosia artemisiifolia TaxID=4212 RepID=A0AAD5DB33_AMBAR|nr:hypothetical protein M8C21_005614 [Ambrosia artemisiifolia]